MLRFLLTLLDGLWKSLLAMFGFSSSQPAVRDQLEVFVRTNTGEKINVCLSTTWNISQIKKSLAPKLNSSEEDLRIIFAGKELPNDMVIGQCDLGHHSTLHAIRVVASKARTLAANVETKLNISDEATSSSSSQEKVQVTSQDNSHPSLPNDEPSTSTSDGSTGVSNVQRKTCGRLLCDASTVITIQMTEAEQKKLRDLKTNDGIGERPHFYVYCVKPCNSVRVGKLRVRCVTCKQGALTLHRDPCNWQDVLNPRQITATCETLGCNGSKAEFFFKCRDHETAGEDDTAVALYLVRANLPAVSCLACTDVSSPVVVFECAESHVMCLDCFVTFSVSRLNERQFLHDHVIGYTLSCPIGCPDSLVREVHHFKLMGDNHYERYQRFGAEEAVLAAGGVLCPYPGCGQGIIPDQDCRRVACLNGCGYVFCRLCLQGYHIGECNPEDGNDPSGVGNSSGFNVDPSRAASSRWDEASSLAIRVTTKPCPKCRTPTERDGGCMHMVCTRASCAFHWCWVCQTEWTRECMAAHWFG
ncbi:E3 ubiquitin-protein ligase parkin [Macrobrachium rosenbergii]|uniref:E3 ubiquitin-protein ligase parkin n=1 Tax=Macrobrachium rosenbergii TaxID=79674 RepID=UPI0034D3EF3E